MSRFSHSKVPPTVRVTIQRTYEYMEAQLPSGQNSYQHRYPRRTITLEEPFSSYAPQTEEPFPAHPPDPDPYFSWWRWLVVALLSFMGGAGTAWWFIHDHRLPFVALEAAATPMAEGLQVHSKDLLGPQFSPPDYQRLMAEQQQTYPINEEWFYTLATEWSPFFHRAQWSELSSWQQAFMAMDLYDRLTQGISPNALAKLGNQGRDYYTTLTSQMEAWGLPKDPTQKQADTQFFEIFPELRHVNIKGYQALSSIWFSNLEDVIQSQSVQGVDALHLAPQDGESSIDFALP